MNIKLDDFAYMPDRAHFDDAGIDLYSPVEVVIAPGKAVCIDTGVHVQLPYEVICCKSREDDSDIYKKRKTCGIIFGRSSLAVKHNITSFMGLIDFGYTGSITVRLRNEGDEPYTIHEGEKISQLVVTPVLTPHLHQVEELRETERGDNGFGSTGK